MHTGCPNRQNQPMPESRSYLLARRATYELLARLYLAAPDHALLEILRDLPGFVELVYDTPLEELQAEHQRLFGLNVYPYESIYVDTDLMLHTAAADQVMLLYEACSYEVDIQRTGAPDHLAIELNYMAHLLAAEAHGDTPAISLQSRCLHEHLARWVPICAASVLRIGAHALYRAAAELTIELVLSDLARILVLNIPLTPQSTPPDEEPGIGRIVRQLLTPCEAGLFLSRADISGLGRALRLPASMTDRFQMLRGLFDAAAQFEQLPALLDLLDQQFAAANTTYVDLINQYPAWAIYGGEWCRRVARTRALLNEMRIGLIQSD